MVSDAYGEGVRQCGVQGSTRVAHTVSMESISRSNPSTASWGVYVDACSMMTKKVAPAINAKFIDLFIVDL